VLFDGPPASKQLFIAILANTKTPTRQSDTWIPIRGLPAPAVWDASVSYGYGDLVTDDHQDTYVAIFDVEADILNDVPSVDTDNWRLVATFPNTPTARGVYDYTTAYSLGDYVQNPSRDGPGQILVQVYDAANFLLLGIPAIL
jgi:hypothetical protein